MLESDFYTRLVYIIAAGLLFIYVMIKSARKNPAKIQRKHIIAKILGALCFILSILLVVSLVRDFKYLDFPDKSLGQPLGPHTIIRDSSNVLYWGYPTTIQNKVFMDLLGILELIAFGFYFVFFKSSASSTGMKILKVALCVLLYFLLPSATDLHYFDIYEIYAPILTVIVMALFVWVGRAEPENEVVQIADVSLTDASTDKKEVTISEEDVKL